MTSFGAMLVFLSDPASFCVGGCPGAVEVGAENTGAGGPQELIPQLIEVVFPQEVRRDIAQDCVQASVDCHSGSFL